MRRIKTVLLLGLLTDLGCGSPPAVLDTTEDKTTRMTIDAMQHGMTPEEGKEFGQALHKVMIKEHGKEKIDQWDGIPTAEMMKSLEGMTASQVLSRANSL